MTHLVFIHSRETSCNTGVVGGKLSLSDVFVDIHRSVKGQYESREIFSRLSYLAYLSSRISSRIITDFNMAETTNDMDTLREELSSQFGEFERKVGETSIHIKKIQRRVGESRGADSSRLEVSSIDEDNLLGVSTSDSEARLLVIDKETQELCCELTALVAAGSYDIPKSTLHGLYSLFKNLSLERKNTNLRKMKAKQQQKALQNKIELLDHGMIDKLYPNDKGKMKNLLKDLTVAQFSGGGNEWVDVNGHYQVHVEHLLRNILIESKPEEPHLVRFCI
ncbi:hypothetical protein J437_LFUL006563 [Ladona fulva]|uniref:Uncharacterized protein n=1 Tax=Ladona fulva TaxID=123851 RepID=A0A8K0K719_LADFU|nr:hypothetical protein J437_LFUL006563 [Ladona fulva]